MDFGINMDQGYLCLMRVVPFVLYANDALKGSPLFFLYWILNFVIFVMGMPNGPPFVLCLN